MLRRQARERREYVYKKALESKQRQIYERKQKIREALASGKPLPPELRGAEAQELAKHLTLDAAQTEPESSIDDEYARAGQYDPRILVTTSRNPSSRLSQFAKELRFVFPNSTRLNRGGYTMAELASAARANGMTDLVVVHEHRGVPDAMVVSHFPHGPTVLFSLHNVTLRHEVATHSDSTVSEQYPHLIFDGFGGRLGDRVRNVLRFLFPVPKEDAKRVMTFANTNDFISFRHHVFVASHREAHLAEVGPRFDMRPYEIRQGTIEQKEADVEWVLRPFMNTARKRSQLAGSVST
ncbi:snoRNA-binding rRNA-processing protein imp4 [Malassezia vespertilionis]|uniref:U3 small nucleolar ribonucleoprotein protein IMP4 n=1 Tax=Malassezia vespertilionis TaxID=2020962 RepID=A0A2N1J835_9BASI|nr:snoRNA-binding rRNA-processing protein imp4 [Malassezia vespertilionis]PKI82727.1 Imp4p [Malassezia vespertilionis]WFD08588.1 snoRNA-binding rRNA-processing protein imp4 [Malassezia vespertilionis]